MTGFRTKITPPSGRRAEWTVTVENGVSSSTTVLDARKPESRQKAIDHFRESVPSLAEDIDELTRLSRQLERAGSSWHEHTVDSVQPPKKPPPFDDIELADADVNLDTVLHDLCTAINRYIVVPSGADVAVALWICHTWCLEGVDYTPRLVVSSPTKRCGKTTMLDVVRGASRRVIAAENSSTAALFRAIDQWRPTLVLDEADNFLVGRDVDRELIGILNGGYRRGGGVLRCDGDDHDARHFDAFSPVAFGVIGKLTDTLMDRSIVIPMRRKKRQEQVERIEPSALLDVFRSFRPMLARWGLEYALEVRGATPRFPDGLGDRARDIWQPLLAIADLAGGCWGELARTAACALTSTVNDDDSLASLLLADVRSVFATRNVERLPTKELLGELLSLEERPWTSMNRGRGLSDRKLAELLSSFEICSRNIRQPDGKIPKGYHLADMGDAFERYLPP